MSRSNEMNGANRSERRGFRRTGGRERGILSARVRPGREAVVVDIAPGGVSIDVSYRLLPGAAIELRVDTPDDHADLKGHILRCCVVQLRPGAVSYRAAIVFDREWPQFLAKGGEYPVPAGEALSACVDGVSPTRNVV